MSTKTLKLILASEDFKKSSLGLLLISKGYEIEHAINEDTISSYYFIVDDYLLNEDRIPRLATSFKYKSIKNMLAYIESKALDDKSKKLISMYFDQDEKLDLVDRYSKDFKDLSTLKIQDYLNLGYFIDAILVEAYKADFEIDGLRNYLNNVLEYTFKLIEKKESLLPIEVSFSHNGSEFAISIATTVPGFKIKEDVVGKEALERGSLEVNFFDMCFIESRERLIISSLYFKGKSSFRSQFYSVIEKRKVQFKTNQVIKNATPIERINYEPFKGREKNDLSEMSLIRKIALYIRNLHREDSSFNFEKITREEVAIDVKTYPIQSEVEKLTEDSYQKIADLLSHFSKNQDDSVFVVSGTDGENGGDVYNISGGGKDEDGFLKVKTIDNDLSMKALELENKLREVEFKFAKSNEQNARMKKLLESMKNEYVKLKSENIGMTFTAKGNDPVATGATSQEKALLKIKGDLEQVVLSKDIKIAQLESRIENFKSEFVKTKEYADREKLDQLILENQSLQSKLELSSKNLSNLSSNLENKEQELVLKKDKEIQVLKDKMQMAQTLIAKFKEEKTQLEEKHREDLDKVRRLKMEELVSDRPKDLTSSLVDGGAIQPESKNHQKLGEENKKLEDKVTSVQAEKRILEDKLKEQGLELKKLEHKLKLTANQLEDAQKKNSRSEKGKAGSNDAYIRQVEQANKKLSEVSEDLTEKKRDNLKLKQENTQLNAKLQELEKKLANLEKKAA